MEDTYSPQELYDAAQHLYRFCPRDNHQEAIRWFSIASWFHHRFEFEWKNIVTRPLRVEDIPIPTDEDMRELAKTAKQLRNRKPLTWMQAAPLDQYRVRILGPLRPPKVKLENMGDKRYKAGYPWSRYMN